MWLNYPWYKLILNFIDHYVSISRQNSLKLQQYFQLKIKNYSSNWTIVEVLHFNFYFFMRAHEIEKLYRKTRFRDRTVFLFKSYAFRPIKRQVALLLPIFMRFHATWASNMDHRDHIKYSTIKMSNRFYLPWYNDETIVV